MTIIPTSSRAVIWRGINDVAVETRLTPEPGEKEVLVRVLVSGLCGTDLHIARGEYPAAKPRVVLGHEYAGEVVAVGDGVKGLSVGDLVAVDPNIPCLQCAFCREGMVHLCIRPENIGSRDDGGLAEYALCAAAQAHRLPAGLPVEAAMLAEPLACTLHAVDRAQIQVGDNVLVIGAGPIGLMAAELAQLGRAGRVTIAELNESRAAFAGKLGYEVLDSSVIAKGRAHVVLESAGAPAAMRQAVDAARSGGTFVWMGVVSPETELPIRPYELFRRELRILGSFTNPFTMGRALALLQSANFRWQPLITHRYELARFKEAWEMHLRGEAIKIAVIPSE